MTKKRNKSMIQRRLIPTYIFLIICSLISVFPLYWMIAAATNESLAVARGSIAFGNQLAINFEHLQTAVQGTLWSSMGNSFFYSIVQTIFTLFVCSIAGYGFELYHDKGKDRLFGILLLAMNGSSSSNNGSFVWTYFESKITQYCMGFHPSRNLNTIYDYDVQTEFS